VRQQSGARACWPAFAALAKQGGASSPRRGEIKRILAAAALQAVTLPANSYAGQSAPLDSVGS